ncbi:3-hydroxy-2-methylbutyryl-CoA dehydrogenase [Serinicoccus chungangensis]|uniref:3-hydroxy-2-methylbutyryl-CoA dehydrogenase n=1 Tax=Serinicoccus chungangensis TaxID=767452 RepID=A0A0W8I9Z7_9MICO|nr:SDR family NAD(P)-dependent oxidoreductase [Serinicoccus chungangensis]KUG56756.1 3-hydroxy-2-methylbutyryl-CoA dehydrogenase [Serinicoccus chungangensis]
MQITERTVALVTGAASGLGEQSARRLLEAGGRVLLVDLPGGRGEELADELSAEHGEGRVAFAAADVRDAEQVAAAVRAAVDLGELRVVVNCAGVATPGRILSRRGVLDLEAYRTVVEINLIGTFNVLRLAAEAMAGNEPDLAEHGDRGVVVMTASVAAFDGQIGQAAYASSKAGVVGLTLTAARDLADKGIRVMTIAPGVFETPMMAGLGDDVKDSLEALVPHPSRLGRPEEYASLVAHIVENPMLNGEVIRLDGALRMPPR